MGRSSSGLSASTSKEFSTSGASVAEVAGLTDSAQRRGHDADEHGHLAGTATVDQKASSRRRGGQPETGVGSGSLLAREHP